MNREKVFYSRANPGVGPRMATASCEAEYARIALSRKDNGALDSTILRTGSFNGREILAWLASGGRLRYNDLVVHAEAFRDPVRRHQVPDIIGSINPEWAVRLARVMALQELYPDDRLNGLTLFRMVLDRHGAEHVSRKLAKEFCDLAISLGEFYLAKVWSDRLKFFKTARRLVEADLSNPFVRPGIEDEGTWWSRFCKVFERYEVQPPILRPPLEDGLEPFDRVEGPQLARVEGGPLVTVGVSAYKPGRALLTSVQSILNQTWQNLEVIVVNDASPEDSTAIFNECENLDERVRVIHLRENGGTYVARNTALDAAKGVFFTTQDDDDWSHPLRIQTQVEALMGEGNVVGCKVNGVRVSGHLLAARPASDTIQENASSLMFWRERAVQTLGYFDSVRKGADTEFALRLERVLGEVRTIPLPFTMIRISSASLSRSDFRPNWRHPARVSYRGAYEHWHELIDQGVESPYRSKAVDQRPFPAPRPFWVHRDAAAVVPEYDFVFIGDWRQYGGPQKSMLEEVRALLSRGFRVGICHMEAFRFMSKQRKPLCGPIRELLHAGKVTEVLRTDTAKVKLVVLRYPPILQFTPAQPFAWRVEQAHIVANQPPHHLDGSDLRYNVTDCIRHAHSLFGVHPKWVPQGPQVRAAITPLVPAEMVDSQDVPGIIAVDPEKAVRAGPLGSRPVIGRYSRDNPIKFPSDKGTLVSAYPVDSDVRVRIMGGISTCEALLGTRKWPENWEMLDYDEEPVEEFLEKIDFFVNFDNDDNIEAFGRSMLEAMASGCVVILPPKFRTLFGEGAVYAHSSEVASLVKRLHADPKAFSRLSRAGVKHVCQFFSHESYVERMVNELERRGL